MDNISNNLKVKPPKEAVYYRVLNIKADEVNKGRLKMPASVKVPNIDTIFDPGDNTIKPIKYVRSTRTKSDEKGKTMVSEVLGDILFYRNNNGLIVIKPENKLDLALFQYMEITNYNLSNPNRDKNIPALFERMDKKKNAKEELEKSIQEHEAIALALNMPYEKLKVIAEEMKVDTNRDPYEVRMAMKVLAQQNPSIFIEKSQAGAESTIQSQINEAIEKQIIAYDEEDRKWYWVQNKANILNVPPTEEPKQALFVFYTENEKGKNSFSKVLDKL